MVLALTCKLYITFNEPYFVKFEVDDVILLFLAYKSLNAVFFHFIVKIEILGYTSVKKAKTAKKATKRSGDTSRS